MEGMGTRTLGMCSVDKTLRDRAGEEGQGEDPKEACVEVPSDWKKREREGFEEQPGLVDCVASWLWISLDNLQRHLSPSAIL